MIYFLGAHDRTIFPGKFSWPPAQLRIQKEAAQQSGREYQLITGDKTNVTDNAAQGTKVIRRKDLGPQ